MAASRPLIHRAGYTWARLYPFSPVTADHGRQTGLGKDRDAVAGGSVQSLGAAVASLYATTGNPGDEIDFADM